MQPDGSKKHFNGIDAARVKGALSGNETLRFDPEVPGWITSGFWAVPVDDDGAALAHEPLTKPGAIRDLLEQAKTDKRIPLTERLELRILPKFTEYTAYEEECDGCDCGKCEGFQLGPYRQRSFTDKGQAVFFDDAGRPIVINPTFLPLLDGLALCALGGIERDLGGSGAYTATLCAYDAEGEPRALIMPMRTQPRDPNAREADL